MDLKYVFGILAAVLVLVAPIAHAQQLSVDVGSKTEAKINVETKGDLQENTSTKSANVNIAVDAEAKMKTNVEASKANFFKIKTKSESCKETEQDCIKAKGDLKIAAKDVIINHFNIVLGRLEKFKAIIIAEASMSIEESSKQMALIDQEISEINRLKEAAEKITADTEKFAIKQLLKESNQKLGEIKVNVEFSNAILANSRLKSTVSIFSKLLEKLNQTMEANASTNTEKIGQLVRLLSERMEKAKNRLETINKKLSESSLKTGEEKKQANAEVQNAIKELKNELKGAHGQLKPVVMEIKLTGFGSVTAQK